MNSLFAIPANQEFVFIPTSKDSVKDWKTELIDSVINLCNNPAAAAESLEELSFHSPSYINEMNATSMCEPLPFIYSLLSLSLFLVLSRIFFQTMSLILHYLILCKILPSRTLF